MSAQERNDTFPAGADVAHDRGIAEALGDAEMGIEDWPTGVGSTGGGVGTALTFGVGVAGRGMGGAGVGDGASVGGATVGAGGAGAWQAVSETSRMAASTRMARKWAVGIRGARLRVS
jgi:hypothetical protein